MRNLIVTLQDPRNGDKTVHAGLDLRDYEECFKPIDVASDDAPAINALFCTPKPDAEKLKAHRQYAAKQIAHCIEKHMLELFEANDMLNGYKKS